MQFKVTNPNTITPPEFSRRPDDFATQVNRTVALPRLDIEFIGARIHGNDAEVLRYCGRRLCRRHPGLSSTRLLTEPCRLLKVNGVGFVFRMESAGKWIAAVFCAISAAQGGLTVTWCRRWLLSPEDHG